LIHHNQQCVGDEGEFVEEDLASKIDVTVEKERRPTCPFQYPDADKE
jgi:hypothetical protein